MTHLQEKLKEEPESRAGWWQAVLVFLGIFSPILPGSLNVAQAYTVQTFQAISWVWKKVTSPGEVFNAVAQLIFSVTAHFTAWMGWLLDLSIEHFVLNMADKVNGISAIDGLWQTFRDLGNIAFIGVLLYIAIRTVLNVGNKFNTKQLLVRLVIVALFVNFSLFATKVVIDTSNVVALQFYNAVQVEDCGLDEGCNLSHFFMDVLNISSVNSPAVIEEKAGGDNFKIFLALLMGAVFMSVTSFVMGAMALLLIIRFVVLVLIMIASPLAFIAFALPGFDNMGQKWVNKLLSQSFFAPAMLAMVYITASMAGGIQNIIGGESNTDLIGAIISDDSSSFDVILVYIILIGLMAASLIVAKQIGAVGAAKTVEWGKKARNWGQATVVGGMKGVAMAPVKGAGAAARESVGRLGRSIDKRFAKSPFSKTAVGETIRKNTTQKLSEDAKFGTGSSYRDVEKHRDKRESEKSTLQKRKEARKEIDSIEKKVKAGLKERSEANAEKRRIFSDLSSKEILGFGKDFLKDHAEALSDNVMKAVDNFDEFQEREKQEIKQAAVETLKELKNGGNVSDGDIKAFLGTRSDDQLKSIDLDLIKQRKVVENMSSDQYKKVTSNKSKKEKDELNKIRIAPFEEAITKSTERDYIGGMKDEDAAQIFKLALKNPNVRINGAMLDEVSPNMLKELQGQLNSQEKETLRQAVVNRGNPGGPRKVDRSAEWLTNGPGGSLF